MAQSLGRRAARLAHRVLVPMIRTLMGPVIDIHGGGQDLVRSSTPCFELDCFAADRRGSSAVLCSAMMQTCAHVDGRGSVQQYHIVRLLVKSKVDVQKRWHWDWRADLSAP